MRGLVAFHSVADGFFVDYVGVRKRHRRQGLGTVLMESVVPRGSSESVHLIVAETKNVHFYARRGFRGTLSSPYDPSIGESALVRVGSGPSTTPDAAAHPSPREWDQLSAQEQSDALVLVAQTERMSTKAAWRLLSPNDPRMRYGIMV